MPFLVNQNGCKKHNYPLNVFGGCLKCDAEKSKRDTLQESLPESVENWGDKEYSELLTEIRKKQAEPSESIPPLSKKKVVCVPIEKYEQLQAELARLKEEMNQLIDIALKIRREVIAQTDRIVGRPKQAL